MALLTHVTLKAAESENGRHCPSIFCSIRAVSNHNASFRRPEFVTQNMAQTPVAPWQTTIRGRGVIRGVAFVTHPVNVTESGVTNGGGCKDFHTKKDARTNNGMKPTTIF